jgi:butyryl-CoA dehydrogenase
MGENDDCRGWLVGEENMGLSYMFRMMNEERINVGIGAIGIASAAYYESLKYATERKQGRPLSSKDPNSPQCEIIEHADIKRMLLFQKAIVEGSLSLAVQVSFYLDMLSICKEEEKEKYELLAEFLTPIVKTYPSEKGILSTSAGLQILGGYGYCEDFNLELFYRDARIHPIHEGTTGIQGQDILGRKVTMKNGKAFNYFISEVQKTIAEAEKEETLSKYAMELKEYLALFKSTTSELLKIAASGKIEDFLSDATLYLEMAGNIAIGWQWLLQGLIAYKKSTAIENKFLKNFYNAKVTTMKYFFRYELPLIKSLSEIILNDQRITVNIDKELFED